MAMDSSWLLAQGQAQEPSFVTMLPPIVAMVVLFFLIMIWPQQRERKKREQMLNSLKKNDRVVTIGGIIGTIANISPDGKEITLKVDDNARIKFLRSSISHKLEDDAPKEEAGKSS
uniref:Sec translocon accessory complex subunit YajC n=1 Tax=Schlesneria paludicola TaxID=360056 RepID=A0A7C4QNW1_9PLAN